MNDKKTNNLRHGAWMAVALAAVVCALVSCGRKLPSSYSQSKDLPAIYPDYAQATIPPNIAPLTFQMNDGADDMVVRFSYNDDEIICGGNEAAPGLKPWRQLMTAAKGHAVVVEVYARHDGQWTRFKPFNLFVSNDSIDPWLCYRLISPSFVTYEELTINQRCLENYDERVIYDNMLCSIEKSGQCINCHHFQAYNPERMQFHARQYQGGTVVAYDGKVKKINMKNDSLLSAGVYPAWHPQLNFIVYSTNKTHQSFHTIDPNKIEVFDDASDLIAFDVERNQVTTVEKEKDELEVFPCWAPDGRTLYYCSAHLEIPDTVKDRALATILKTYEIKYNIYKKDFNPQTMQFGPRQLVFDAAALDKSATLPRISPDGRRLMFTLGEFGVFHIWHHDADLWMMDLETSETAPLTALNSADTESYHSWSSNGRWVVFSSRRTDGNFTRPFIAHIDEQGKCGRPFELPSRHADYHRQLMKSYNVPELVKGPVTVNPRRFAEVLKTDGEPPVEYVKQLQPAR